VSIKDQISNAQTLLGKVKMPILPQAALDLQQLFNHSAMPAPDQVKRLISMNPLLAGELVSLANQPSLLSTIDITIKDIDSAIYRLGHKKLKNYILSIYIKKMLDDHKIKGLSYHSQDIAIIAAEIARFNPFIRSDEAYLLGLVHDIGSFILSDLDENYGDTFVGRLLSHHEVEQYELKHYGTTHSALGYVIAHSWSIPNYISQTILLHHTPHICSVANDKLRNLIAIIELAHAISTLRNSTKDNDYGAEKIKTECQIILGLSDEELNKISLLS